MPTITSVPLLDLQAQYRAIKPELDEAVSRVVESQQFINGPDVAALEAELADYCGASHAVGLSSGTDAILVALMALDIGPGDEVVTSPYTFFATAGSIARVGAKPVFADIDPATYNIDPRAAAAAVTPRTRAIMPVHLFGQCADMDPLLKLADRHGLAVIEDAAQAIGAEDKGRRAGAMGTVGCFSFFPSKNLGGFGDGGAVTTNDAALADKIALLRNHGMKPKYHHKIVGGNFRLDTLQAAVLRVKLRYLDGWTAARQRHAAGYAEAFHRDGRSRGTVQTPAAKQGRHVYNQYVVRVPERERLRDALKRETSGTRSITRCRPTCKNASPASATARGCFRRASELPRPPWPCRCTRSSTDEQKRYVADSVASFYATATVSRAA